MDYPKVQVVYVAAWIPYAGYVRLERYVSPKTGSPLPMVQVLFHCVKAHAVEAKDLLEARFLTSCLDVGVYTGVGLLMLMPEERCPVCRKENGLPPYSPPPGTITSNDPQPPGWEIGY